MNRSWPVGLVGLCMAALGAFGIWVVREQDRLFTRASEPMERILVFALLGFVAVMGLWSLAITVMNWNKPPSPIPGFMMAYRDAWLRFAGQKWILVLAGFVALVNIVSGVTEFALSRHYLADYLNRGMHSGGLLELLSKFSGHPPIAAILERLPKAVSSTLDFFLPMPGIGTSTIAVGLLALGVLALLPWAGRQLAALERQSTSTPAIRLFRRLIWPIGIISLITAIGQFWQLWYSYAALAHSTTAYAGPQTIPFAVQLIASSLISGIFRTGVVLPLLIGGLAGSLWRSADGSPVGTESFLKDSVRAFVPIEGIFLLFFLLFFLIETLFSLRVLTITIYRGSTIFPSAEFALAWRLLMVILMFAPYAAYAGAGSTWRGLWESVNAWRNCGYNLLSFTALGISGLTIVLTVIELLRHLIGTGISPLSIIPSLVTTVIRVAVSVFMAVAVWEFYTRMKTAARI